MLTVNKFQNFETVKSINSLVWDYIYNYVCFLFPWEIGEGKKKNGLPRNLHFYEGEIWERKCQ
jgi:hypothetical protein